MSFLISPRRCVSRFSRPLLGAALALAAPCAHAAFAYPQLGARSASMSGASISSRGDSDSIYGNVAGLAGLEQAETSMMYAKLYAGLPGVDSIGRSLITVGVPTRIGTIGVGLSDFKAAGLLNERVLGAGFSRRVFTGLDAGVTIKYLHLQYAPGSDQTGIDPVFANGTSRGAAAFDAGVIATLSKTVRTGFAVRNINTPDLGLDSEDRVPREYQASLSYERTDWWLRATTDIVYRDDHLGTLRDRATPSIGFEKGLGDERVKFRIGATLDQFSAGVGMQFDRIGFDYAFILTRNLIANNAGSHLIGIRYRFGGTREH